MAKYKEHPKYNVVSIRVSDEEKAQLFRTAEVYVSPATGGESFGIVLVAVVAAWLVAGFTTSEPAVCTGCHVETVHDTVAPEGALIDPHENTSCVSCHEPGGRIGRYASDVPGRLAHFIDGIGGTTLTGEYGRMTQAACRACHSEADPGIVVDEERGLRMSHEEPVAAKMRCLDCHTPVSGVVAAHNAGMNPCLRCHDSKIASAECTTCHDRGAAAAARARTVAFSKQQIAVVTCGGCHNEKNECDPCHGVRMPHSPQFMVYNHARAGAVDVWDNDGAVCGKCHTEKRRPCTRCHNQWPGNGHQANLGTTHANADETHCNSCHQKMGLTNARSFCVDVCHTPSAMEGSPR